MECSFSSILSGTVIQKNHLRTLLPEIEASTKGGKIETRSGVSYGKGVPSQQTREREHCELPQRGLGWTEIHFGVF